MNDDLTPPSRPRRPLTRWEENSKEAVEQLLALCGEDTGRDGLDDTPERVVRFFYSWARTDEGLDLTTFDAEGHSQMIVQGGIPVYSLCEHHMLPFFGRATVAYLPDDQVVGLSKLTRVVRHFMRGLQNQERLTDQVGTFLSDELAPRGVGVIVQARHLCMEMRGVKRAGTHTTTAFIEGAFRENESVKSELYEHHRNAQRL